ncbi:MAG: c-type cytochrome [Caldilineales bacterium]|nr:c-type cytochrome [Caldilineales bacterium]
MQRRQHQTKLSLKSCLWGFAIVLGIVIWAGLPASPAAAQGDGPQGAAYRGESIFSQRCVQCHGPGGHGDGPMAAEAPVPIADFTDPEFAQTRSPQVIFDIITEGRLENLMPPWGNALSESERWDLVAYIWSLHLTPTQIESGQITFEGSCADCHGLDGSGNPDQPTVPDLAGTDSLQLTEAEWQGKAATEPHPAVEGVMDKDVLQAATFARSFGLGFDVTEANVTGNGLIQVQVLNGTTGEIQSDAQVELRVFDADGPVTSQSTTTDAQGMATFESLSTEPIWGFMLETQYNGASFSTDFFQFEPGISTIDMPLNVYEPGATADDIRINRAHWVVSIENPHTLEVGELYSFVNTSNRLYTGEMSDGVPRVLQFDLPENAINVSFEGMDSTNRYVQDGNVFYDTVALPPGQHQVLFQYSLPVEDNSVTIQHPIAYPIDNLNLLAPDMGISVEASGWTIGQPLQAQGGAFLNYTQTSLPADSTPRAVISGIEANLFADSQSQNAPNQQVIDPFATPGISGQPYIIIVVVVLSIAVLAVGTIILMRRQRQQLAMVPDLRRQQRQDLIQQIADLDDAYEAGEVSEADYQAERGLLKSQLVTLSNRDAA